MQSTYQLILDLCPAVIWAYNRPMQIVNFPPQENKVGASGECPHCSPTKSYFRPLTSHVENAPNGFQKLISAAQCESCKNFVLVVAHRNTNHQACVLDDVFPLGKPNDWVDVNVPKEIAADFSEALRCHFIKSYRASVVMCRRAIQSSSIELKAKGGRLIDQIDDLFSSGKITEALKDFAHEVRLTGNDGAHPDKDGLADVGEQDSNDIIDFTREYLHHVYIMPAKLKARRTPAVTT